MKFLTSLDKKNSFYMEKKDLQKNVLGENLEECSLEPLTGWYRDGCCNTDKNDHGIKFYLQINQCGFQWEIIMLKFLSFLLLFLDFHLFYDNALLFYPYLEVSFV